VTERTTTKPSFAAAAIGVTATVSAVLAVSSVAWARDYEVELEIESLDDLYELYDSGDVEADSLEVLEALFERPLNLNRADRYLLYELPGVTYELADAIVAYRAEHGAFESLEGLLGVEGMTPRLLRSLSPFATVGGSSELPVDSTTDLRAEVELGSLWLEGFGRDSVGIDTLLERSRGPQSYLQMRTTGFGSLGAGALLTHRRRTDVQWDRRRGQMVSDGPGNALDIEGGYVYGGYGAWSVILGSYTVGFGERLTFDTTTKSEPHGWAENDMLSQYNSDGRIGGRSGQLGVAISMTDVETGFGWLDVTAFGSWTPNDLYQYDFNHGFDEWYGVNICDTDGDCPEGYTCGDDHMCRSSRIYDAADLEQPSYRYETIRDAYDEKLAGGNVTFEISERTRFGVTGYWGQTDFNIATSAQPTFSWSARMPRDRNEYGAMGANLRFGVGSVDVAAEYARTDLGGNAVFARAIYSPGSWGEITLSGRYYDAVFDNPHSRPRAQRDELHGLAGRNETGGRLEATIKPMSGLRLVTNLDMWANPWLPQFNDLGEVSYVAKSEMPLDLNVSQRITWGFTRDEDISLLLDYKNKDITNNGREEVYWLGDFCDEGENSNCGRGESRKVQVRLGTDRVPRSHFWVSYSAIWEDASKYDTEFDYQQRIKAHARVNVWPGGRVIASGGLWFHKRDPMLGSTDPVSDRGDAALDTFLELSQTIGDHFTVLGRYGVVHYQDERPERYAWFHLAKLALEARY